MTADDAADIADAKELIAERGELCQWCKPSPADPNAKPWRDVRAGIPATSNVSIAFFSPIDLQRGSGQAVSIMPGVDIASYSEIGLMAGGNNFEPEITDYLIRTSGKAEIVAIDKVAPDGVGLLYYVAVK